LKRVLLLRPNSKRKNYQELENELAAIAPPIWMAFRASHLEKLGYDVKVIDAEIDDFDIDNPPAVDIEIFPSGNHSSAYIQQKEGITELAAQLDKRNYKVKIWDLLPLIDIDDSPDWSKFPMDKYKCHNWHNWSWKYPREPYGIVCSSWSCSFRCDFCAVPAYYGTGFKERDLDLVFSEIKDLVENYNVKNFKFIDEMFLFHHRRIAQLCDMIIAQDWNLNIWAYAKIDIMPPYILPKLKQAGFRWLGIGIESGNEAIRKNTLKGRYTNQQIKDTIGMIKASGIYISGAYIFGFLDDNIDTMYETLDFAKELNCEQSNFHCMMIYPNSSIYEIYKKMGWYLPQKWSEYSQYSYDCHPARTRYLTSAQVLRFRDDAFHDYYTSDKYLNMMIEKFGEATVEEIKAMTKIRLRRKLYNAK
jgi:radical SAM superfamily enzyme YgiQ (UPF0313 family)